MKTNVEVLSNEYSERVNEIKKMVSELKYEIDDLVSYYCQDRDDLFDNEGLDFDEIFEETVYIKRIEELSNYIAERNLDE